MTASSLQGAEGEANALHVVMVGDDLDHVIDGQPCPCSPTVTTLHAEDGTPGLMVVHRIIVAELLPSPEVT